MRCFVELLKKKERLNATTKNDFIVKILELNIFIHSIFNAKYCVKRHLLEFRIVSA